MTETKRNLTELVFIIDRSGSMSGLESDTVGGFNSMIERQKEAGCECLVTTVLFNHATEKLHDRVPLESVKKLTSDDYVPSGSTALIDAVGETIDHVKTIHRYIRPEDLPEKTLFVITTDGQITDEGGLGIPLYRRQYRFGRDGRQDRRQPFLRRRLQSRQGRNRCALRYRRRDRLRNVRMRRSAEKLVEEDQRGQKEKRQRLTAARLRYCKQKNAAPSPFGASAPRFFTPVI